MLKHLRIENYVLIDHVDLPLLNGLTAITGETGSGKSILLGALGLILGERAEHEALRNVDAKCIVEASFALDESLKPFFIENDLDFEALTIVRREITPAGKSRAFINDTPVTLKVLKDFGSEVVDIHSQLETSRLREKGFRFELLDAAAQQTDHVLLYQRNYRAWLQAKKELEHMREHEAQSKADLDYYRFQLNELDDLKLDSNGWDDMAQEAETLRHAGSIAEALREVSYRLDEGEQPVIAEVKKAITALEATANVHQPSAALLERLKSVYLELKDLSMEATGTGEAIAEDPQRLEAIEQQLDELYRIQNKHRLNSTSELRELQIELTNKVASIDHLDEAIEQLAKAVDNQHAELLKLGAALHAAREQAALKLESEVSAILSRLKMPDAKLQFALNALPDPGPFGCSDLQLLFTANKGSSPQPLEKSASGGELSRLMLALKAVVTEYKRLPTLILDEIDTGVSGDVAARMADAMALMARSTQLIAISHLPQVAGKATNHLKVFKEVIGDRTFTRLQSLEKSERVEELAGMLSGEVITDSAREHARALLGT
ncbi:MAG: DNA repair protein RecN [Flavobacteriales bacterium]